MDLLYDIHDDDDYCEKVLDMLFDSDDENAETRVGRSVVGRAPNIERNRELGAVRLYNDYFCDSPTYPEHIFARRFRMSRRLFTSV